MDLIYRDVEFGGAETLYTVGWGSSLFTPAPCAMHIRRDFGYWGEILRFVRHVAPMGVKFGMEELSSSRLLHAKFHP